MRFANAEGRRFSLLDRLARHTPATKLHFLIHPGFLAAVHEGINPEEVAYGNSLFKRYERKVSGMRDDALLVAVLHLSACDANQNQMLEWQMERLAGMLGKRFVLFDSTVQIFRTMPEPLVLIPTLLRVVRARGYSFDQETPTEVFGETLGSCVQDAAEYINLTGNFARRTVIDVSCCDHESRPLPRLLEHVKRIEAKFDMIRFSLDGVVV